MASFVTWISGSLSWFGTLPITPRFPAKLSIPRYLSKKLNLNSEQEEAIRKLYSENREYRTRFVMDAPSQTAADRILHANGLSQTAQPQNKLENCWLTAWSSTWGSKKGVKKRSLFQWCVSYSRW